jgi:hypothetical protein
MRQFVESEAPPGGLRGYGRKAPTDAEEEAVSAFEPYPAKNRRKN